MAFYYAKGAMMGENKVETIENRVPSNIRYRIIACLRGAIEEDLAQYKNANHLATYNAIPFLKGDYINTRLQNELVSEDIEVVPFTRYGWESRLVIDHSNKIAYNVISKNRMCQLMKEAASNNVPHYTLLFAYALNNDLQAPQKQMSFFDNYPFDDDIMVDGYNKLVGGQLQRDSGYRYCVITYEVSSGQLLDCEILMLDKDLDIVTKVELTEFITPEYSTLTMPNSNNAEAPETQPRVKLKKKFVQDSSSLVTLRDETKEKRA